MLELVVFIGAFVQELIAVLPSFVVFTPAGASLMDGGKDLWYVVLLAFFIGISRVLAGLLLYRLSDGLRVRIYKRRRAWLGVTRHDIDKVKRKIGEHGSWWSIFMLWAIPIVPSTVISLGAGFMKIPLPTFMGATYVGSVINALTYLCIGYFGLRLFS